MRKKTINFVLDKFVWFFILLLPLFIWLISSNRGINTFDGVLLQFGISDDNIVYSALNSLFGPDSDSIIHFFTLNSNVLLYFTYFVIVEIVHLFIDFIVFIPRLAHKFMNKFTQED